jgi:putative transposase
VPTRAIKASLHVIEGADVLAEGFRRSRYAWNEVWWCAVGYNSKLRWKIRRDLRSVKELIAKGVYPKYPGKFTMGKELKDHWAFAGLSDRCSGGILDDFDAAMRSWFANVRSNPDARPPRPLSKDKDECHILKFQIGRNAKPVGNWQYRLTVLGGKEERRHTTVQVHVRPGVKMDSIKWIYVKQEVKKNRYQISLLTEREAASSAGDAWAGLDLGIINIGALAISDGTHILYSGKQMLDTKRHAQKRAKDCKPSGYTGKEEHLASSPQSKRYLNHGSRSVDLAVQNFTTHVITVCAALGAGRLAVGDLTGIRKDKDFGKAMNQKLHQWPFARIIEQLKWKGEEHGVEVIQVSERYTSQICSGCGQRRKSNRVERGLYVCDNCELTINADMNGAVNIMSKVSPSAIAQGVGADFTSAPSPVPESSNGQGREPAKGDGDFYVAKYGPDWSISLSAVGKPRGIRKSSHFATLSDVCGTLEQSSFDFFAVE